MSSFKLSDLLGEQTAATTTATTGSGEWDIQHIPLELIDPAPNNDFRICEIEALADSIKIDGLMSPLVVRAMPDSGRYEIISGERRYTAIKMLHDRGVEGYDTAPCKVEFDVDDLMAEIKLIHANSTTRVLTDQEKVNQGVRLAELFRQLRSSGTKVKGKKRDFVAGMLGISSAQVGRMESVDKNLVPDAKAEFQQGNMNFSTAYETSLLPEEQQQQVVNDLRQGEKVDIKSVKQRRKTAATPDAPPADKQMDTESQNKHKQSDALHASAFSGNQQPDISPAYVLGAPIMQEPHDTRLYSIGVDYGADRDYGAVTVICRECGTVIISEIIKESCCCLEVPKDCPYCQNIKG